MEGTGGWRDYNNGGKEKKENCQSGAWSRKDDIGDEKGPWLKGEIVTS